MGRNISLRNLGTINNSFNIYHEYNLDTNKAKRIIHICVKILALVRLPKPQSVIFLS